MKKALLIIFTVLAAIATYAQSGLFETVYTNPFDNNINDIAPHPSGWLSVGHKDDCAVPYLTRVDTTGNIAWQHHKPSYFSFAWYNTIAEANSGFYITGHNMIADDYPADDANGFIDFLDYNDSVVNVVTDTTYKGGFHKIAINDSLILVSAIRANYAPKVPIVVCYDTAGNWLWEHEFPNRNIVNIHFMDALIWVVTDSFTYQMSLQGQLLPGSINQPSISSYISQDTLIALVDRDNYANFFNASFDFITFTRFGLHFFDLIDIYSTTDDKHYALMFDSINNQFIVTREGGVPSNWIELPDYCTTPVALSLKDSITAIGGYLETDKVDFGVMRTADLRGNYYQHQSQIELIFSYLSIDTIVYRDTFDNLIVYNGSIDFAVVNTGADTLFSFLFHTELLNQFNCSKDFGDSLYVDLAVPPGDTLFSTLELQYMQFFLPNTDTAYIQYDVYAVGPNQKLTDNCILPITTTPYVYVGINDPFFADATSVFPNPFDNSVSFTNLQYGTSINVYNLQGKTLAHTMVGNDATSIDLGHLLSGIYIYRITNSSGQQIKTGKLIKQ